MQRVILQVPMDKQLKNNAEKVASQQGFSSLQEIVRVFLAQLSSNKVVVSLHESTKLSSINEKRYAKMTRDFESDRDVNSAKDMNDLLSKLNAD